MKLPLFVFAALVPALALPASAQNSSEARYGVELGYLRFSSSRTSDTFGGNGFSISPAFGAITSGNTNGVSQRDFGVNISRGNGNTLVFVPIGQRYTKALSDGATRPYVGGSLNLVPAYSRIETQNLGGRLSLGVGGSVLAGINFNNRLNLEARYFALSKVRGYDLSHTEIALGVRF